MCLEIDAVREKCFVYAKYILLELELLKSFLKEFELHVYAEF